MSGTEPTPIQDAADVVIPPIDWSRVEILGVEIFEIHIDTESAPE